MMQPVDGRKRFAGRLAKVADGEITLELENGPVRLAIEDIHKARLAPEL
jgi:ribosome maturation factor RimP